MKKLIIAGLLAAMLAGCSSKTENRSEVPVPMGVVQKADSLRKDSQQKARQIDSVGQQEN